MGKNVIEVITIPYPIFIQTNYEITFWTQYMSQMNQLLESLLVKTDGQGREFQLVSSKGFKFTAFLEGSFASNDNFENYTGTERIIKHSFTIRVPAYILAPKHPGISTAYRVFHTAPEIVFDNIEIRNQVAEPPPVITSEQKMNEFILSDVTALNEDGMPLREREESNLQTVDDSGGNRKYRSLVSRKPRDGEKISTKRIITQIEETKD